MTREEIEKSRAYQTVDAAFNYCRKNHPHYDGDMLGEIADAFEAGVEWADKTMIDKACGWLESAIRPYAGYSDTADIVESFRKAMEE